MITRRNSQSAVRPCWCSALIGLLGGPAWRRDHLVLELMAKGAARRYSDGLGECARHHHRIRLDDLPALRGLRDTSFPKLKEKYIDTGKVRFIMREFPLDGLAAAAFMLARCAGPDKYYPMVETLFAQQAKWAVRNPIEPLMAIAKQAGFTQQTFEACINDKDQLTKIQQVRDRAAQTFKVKATPTFFINGESHEGGLTMEELDKLIEPYLKA